MTSEPSAPDGADDTPNDPAARREINEDIPTDPDSASESGVDQPARPSRPRQAFIPNLGINDALMASIRNVVRSAMPTLNVLPRFYAGPRFNLDLPQTVQMPDLGWTKLLTPQTDAFLQQVRFQIPTLAFPQLIKPDLTARLAGIAEWIKRLTPENLRDLKFAEWQRLIDISEEQRIGIVWVLRPAVLRPLLDADSEEGRSRVLNEEAAVILEDCLESLQTTTHEDLADLVLFAEQAIKSQQAGHTAPAQALATNVLDTALEQNHVGGVSAMQREWKRLRAQEPDSSTLLETRLRLATAGIPHSYRDYKYEKRDPRYSRNGTAHAVNAALYTSANSLRAITLATAWLRWLHETWVEEDGPGGETPPDEPASSRPDDTGR